MVTLALPTHPFAPAWAIGTGALLGVGAHLANVLPDLEDDAATGVRGFPHRLGRTRTAALAPLALLAATVCVTLGPVGPPTTVGLVGVAAATGLAMAAGVIALRRRRSRLPFTLTIAVAALDVALLIAAGPGSLNRPSPWADVCPEGECAIRASWPTAAVNTRGSRAAAGTMARASGGAAAPTAGSR